MNTVYMTLLFLWYNETINVIEQYKKTLQDEGFPVVYEWFDEAETIYEKHEHQDKVSFYIVEGNLTMNFQDKSIELKKGDRFDVPPKTKHSAVVGGDGCRYVVGQMTKEDV